ncbi:MAG: hypothetical protein Kow0042_13480 [Calditrichia bacterium]
MNHNCFPNKVKYTVMSCLLLSVGLLAQIQPPTIQGVVTDEKGNPLPFANVYVQGHPEGSTTDEDGYFQFQVKSPGSYTLICSYIGFLEHRQNITLRSNEVLSLTIVLGEAAIESKGVTVTASAFTSGDEEGVVLTPLEIVSTPGAAADVFWAIKTYPGVQQVDEGAGLFVRGGDVSETAVVLDGAYLMHPYKYESPNGG